MKIVIIDDESGARKSLEKIIELKYPRSKVTASCKNLDEAVKAIKETDPDLVFLDIRLGAENGFDLFNYITSITFQVVFTTAYDQYAIQAIKHSALDYLLKPIDIVQLSEVIEKANLQIQVKEANLKQSGSSDIKKIGLAIKDSFLFVDYKDIVRCESDGSYCTIFLSSGQKAVVSKNMKEVEESLSDPTFIRIHQSHLINLHHVLEYQKGEGGIIVMKGGTEIPVSRRKKEELFNRMVFIK